MNQQCLSVLLKTSSKQKAAPVGAQLNETVSLETAV